LQDSVGRTVAYNPTVWVADSTLKLIEFQAPPRGFSAPFTLTYWQYRGAGAGSAIAATPGGYGLLATNVAQPQTLVSLTPGTLLPIFVFEKPSPNPIAEKNLTKDGIHIVIGIQADKHVQILLRNRLIAETPSIWSDIPFTNTWDEIFDDGIAKRTCGWQLYGSRKPNHDAYRLVNAYTVSFDETDNEASISTESIETFECADKFPLLSVRYRNHITPFMTSTFSKEYANAKGRDSGKSAIVRTSSATNLVGSVIAGQYSNANILAVNTKDELAACLEQFLEFIKSQSIEGADILDMYHYTMALPESYYGQGSFSKWIRVGWALCNTSNVSFIIWVVFSAQSSGFAISDIRGDLWDRWQTFSTGTDGLTKRSIVHWCKQDAFNKYKLLREDSMDYYIELSLNQQIEYSTACDKKPQGGGDWDIACCLHKLMKDEYICADAGHNKWFQYKNHRWIEDDSGISLRSHISNTLRRLYRKKSREVDILLNAFEEGDTSPEGARLNKKMKIINALIERLGQTRDKNNIITESKELFYDSEFLDKLDKNEYLLCFNNGVFDFKADVFRSGYPEDYISKTTNIDYVPNNPVKHKVVMAEIHDFMHKLMPNSNLYEYLWDHLASILIGVATNQTFNMYIGMGQNGKSVLVNLMEKVLGKYKGELPLSYITRKRADGGKASPEMALLKGVRYAVMQEPSKGDRINEGIMKELTSGVDPIQCRGLYSAPITFLPQFKLAVCSNEYMEIQSNDHGTWRRIRVVKFDSLFTDNPVSDDPEKPHQYKIDRNITDKFENWKVPFMAMLVERARQTKGFVRDCAEVLAASNSYREKQDYLAEFVRDRVAVSRIGECIQKTALGQVFGDWYKVNYGNKRADPKEIYAYMDKTYGRLRNGMWTGVRVKYDMDAETQAEEDANGEEIREDDIGEDDL